VQFCGNLALALAGLVHCHTTGWCTALVITSFKPS
jgi:hypothetical protein